MFERSNIRLAYCALHMSINVFHYAENACSKQSLLFQFVALSFNIRHVMSLYISILKAINGHESTSNGLQKAMINQSL